MPVALSLDFLIDSEDKDELGAQVLPDAIHLKFEVEDATMTG
jgi:hypothetical protein